MNDLQKKLQVIQNENLALYDEATTLRQQKNAKEKPTVLCLKFRMSGDKQGKNTTFDGKNGIGCFVQFL